MAEQQFTTKEQEKATILTTAINGELTNAQAAKQLGLTVRQIQRIKAKIRVGGIKSVIHQLKGKPGNHRYSPETKETIIKTIKKQYEDFKPSFATEKLAENHAICISRETTRLWMIENGLWKARKQKKVNFRSWRPRKEYFGELQQFDGSYHYWFEDRYIDTDNQPIESCLLAAIDDATSTVTKATFAQNEGIQAVFNFWKEYIEEYGKPIGIYLDKFSTYKINHKAAVDNTELMTQFQRVMQQLGITLITAHSPEAKGRIERLFQTLQDRLVKEMRLAGINNPKDGNIYLKEIFLSKFNKKYAVIANKDGDIHRTLQKVERKQIDHIFSVHDERRIKRDFTIQYQNHWYQLLEVQPTTIRPREVVIIETWLDHSVHILFKNQELKYMHLAEKPFKQRANHPLILTTHELNYIPPANHPWRKRTLPERG